MSNTRQRPESEFRIPPRYSTPRWFGHLRGWCTCSVSSPRPCSTAFRASERTREVYLAGGRLNPSESLAVARHSAHGFGWGDGGSGAAQLALALLLRATDRASAVVHYQAFKWEVIARLPQADFTLALSTVHDWLALRSAP